MPRPCPTVCVQVFHKFGRACCTSAAHEAHQQAHQEALSHWTGYMCVGPTAMHGMQLAGEAEAARAGTHAASVCVDVSDVSISSRSSQKADVTAKQTAGAAGEVGHLEEVPGQQVCGSAGSLQEGLPCDGHTHCHKLGEVVNEAEDTLHQAGG